MAELFGRLKAKLTDKLQSPDRRKSSPLPRFSHRSLATRQGWKMTIEQPRSPRFAVLIDADNTSPQIASGLFEEIAKFGEASVRRIYGDFSGPQLKSWAEILQKHAIDPYQQFAYTKGKNASDIALVIDAMDLLHSGRFDGFCLVSPALLRGCANTAPTFTASVPRKRRRAFGRRAADSSTPKICCLRRRQPARMS
jgi:hypothetical protein